MRDCEQKMQDCKYEAQDLSMKCKIVSMRNASKTPSCECETQDYEHTK